MLEKLERFECLKRGVSGINLDPLQRGGILYPEAREALLEWGDGYSVCDFCDGELDRIKNPPIEEFVHGALPEFLRTDEARVTHGAREGMYAAMNSLGRPGDRIVVDGNAHYSTVLAAERAGLSLEYVPAGPAPGYKVEAEDYALAFQRVRETGARVALGVLTYPDGNYGNLVEAGKVAEICHQEGVPFMINGAYAVGRMPVDARALGADILIGSGHKSMASCGPIGVMGTTSEMGKIIFRKSALKKNKEVELLGCTLRGAGLMTMMASFPQVVERTRHWDREVEKARWLSARLWDLGIEQQGDRPHYHDLMFFRSEVLYQISQKAKKGRYFLYRDLKERGICGIKAGLTRQFKLSTYLLSQDKLEQVAGAFEEIISSRSTEATS